MARIFDNLAEVASHSNPLGGAFRRDSLVRFSTDVIKPSFSTCLQLSEISPESDGSIVVPIRLSWNVEADCHRRRSRPVAVRTMLAEDHVNFLRQQRRLTLGSRV